MAELTSSGHRPDDQTISLAISNQLFSSGYRIRLGAVFQATRLFKHRNRLAQAPQGQDQSAKNDKLD